MNDALGLLGVGLLSGLMNGWQQKQDVADYNKGLAAILSAYSNSDPNSKTAQDAYMAQTYGNNPAYQKLDTRITDVKNIFNDKADWNTQNDLMNHAATNAAALRDQLSQQGINPDYLSPDLSYADLNALLPTLDDTTRSSLEPLAAYKKTYEDALAARTAIEQKANTDRQTASQDGVPLGLIGSDISKAPNVLDYSGGLGLTQAQVAQYLADKNNPGAAVARTFDPIQFQGKIQQALVNSGINMDTIQKLSPMLQSMVQNATEKNTKQQYSQFIPSLLNGDPAQQKYALVNMYLTDPKRMPYEVLKELVSSNVKPVDSGNQILMYRTDAYNNFLDNDQNGKPVPYFAIDKHNTPGELLNAQVAMRGQDVTMRGQNLNYDLGLKRDATTRRGQDLNYDLGLRNNALGYYRAQNTNANANSRRIALEQDYRMWRNDPDNNGKSMQEWPGYQEWSNIIMGTGNTGQADRPAEYTAIMNDIWNSKTQKERQAKFQQYLPTLKQYEAAGIPVQNDLEFIKNGG